LSTTQLLRAFGGRPLDATPGAELVVAALVNQAILGEQPQLNVFGNDNNIGLASLGRQQRRGIFDLDGAFGRRPARAKLAKQPKGPQPTRLAYNTPSLVGVGATAPYLHDGSAQSLRELLTTGNPGDRMGRTSHLSPRDIDALVAYLETL